MPQDVKGNVFITGSATGIGAATTQLLAQQGYMVYAGVHHSPATAVSPRIRYLTVDVTDPANVATAAADVAAEVGAHGLRAVINNAGLIVQGPLELIPPAHWRRQFEVNTLGPVFVTQSFLPLVRAGSGRIINVGAATARVPAPFLSPIGASKAALANLSDALRLELAAWRIPVTIIEPGGAETEIFAKAQDAADIALSETDPARAARYRLQLAAVAKAAAGMKLGPVDQIAATIAKAVAVRSPKRRYSVGRDVRAFGILAHLPAGLRERAITTAFGLGTANKAATNMTLIAQ